LHAAAAEPKIDSEAVAAAFHSCGPRELLPPQQVRAAVAPTLPLPWQRRQQLQYPANCRPPPPQQPPRAASSVMPCTYRPHSNLSITFGVCITSLASLTLSMQP